MKALHVPAGVGSPEMWGIVIPGNSRQLTVDWPVDQSTRTANLNSLQAAQNVGGTVEFTLTVEGKALFAAAIAEQNAADKALAGLAPAGGSGGTTADAIAAAVNTILQDDFAALAKQEGTDQAALLAAIGQVDENTLATFGLKRV